MKQTRTQDNPSFRIATIAMMVLAFSHGALAGPTAPSGLGALEASGARLGMDMELAIKALSETKPRWAEALAASEAARDCAAEGRAIANMEFSGGLVSARMDATCSASLSGKPILSAISIASMVAPGLTADDVKAALYTRYGPPSFEESLVGGGFEIRWNAALTQDPSAPCGEYIAATLRARATDRVPISLLIKLASDQASAAKPALIPSSDKAKALGQLPF